MKKYYYLNGNQQVGPFPADHFSQQPVGPDTLVWTDGLPDWKRRADVPEINALFLGQQPIAPPVYQPQPGSYPAQGYQQPYPQQMHGSAPMGSFPPKTWLVESILATLFCCLPFGIVGIINAAKVESRFRMGDLPGAKQASDEAGRWTKISFFVAIGGWILCMALIFMGIVAGIGSNRYY
jgi:hypothetical protein